MLWRAAPGVADGKPSFTGDGNVQGVLRYLDLMQKDKVANPSNAQYDNGTQVLEGDAATQINDTYTVRLASAPTGATSVQLAWDTAEISLTTGDPRWSPGTKTIEYSAADWFVPVTFTTSPG